MKRAEIVFLIFASLPVALAGKQDTNTMLRTTGWFVDEWCAPARLKVRPLRPTNRECAQRCIDQGAKVVFLDETAQRILLVANPEIAKDQESHYVWVVGSLDASSQTLYVKTFEVLKKYSASCALPEPKSQ